MKTKTFIFMLAIMAIAINIIAQEKSTFTDPRDGNS